MVDPFLPDEDKVRALRELLPAVGAGVYLDVATAGPFPAETARALQEADDWELRVGRGGLDRDAELDQREQEARAVVAALLGADPDDVVLTHGIADGRLRLASAVDPTHPLRHVAHVDASDGTWTRVVATADPARQELTVLDAGFSAGAVPLDVDTLGVDAVLVAGHRWLLAPEGTGALWLGPRLREALDLEALVTASDPLSRRALLGLARSVGWLAMFVGLPWAYERTARLCGALADALAAIEGVTVLSPRDRLAAIVTFTIDGWDTDQVLDELSRRAHAILSRSPGRDAVRASVGCWNTEEELERFAGSVGELARHTPDTLPRRPALVILRSDGA